MDPKQKKPTLAEMVDELGALNEKLAPKEAELKPMKARASSLEKAIAAEVQAAPDESKVLSGKLYGATVGPKKNQTVIPDMGKVLKALKRAGQDAAELVTITLEKLKGAVGEVQMGGLVKTDRTGTRTVDTFRLPPA